MFLHIVARIHATCMPIRRRYIGVARGRTTKPRTLLHTYQLELILHLGSQSPLPKVHVVARSLSINIYVRLRHFLIYIECFLIRAMHVLGIFPHATCTGCRAISDTRTRTVGDSTWKDKLRTDRGRKLSCISYKKSDFIEIRSHGCFYESILLSQSYCTKGKYTHLFIRSTTEGN